MCTAAGQVQHIATELDAIRDSVRALLPLQWCMLKLTGMLAVGRTMVAAAATHEMEAEMLAVSTTIAAATAVVETAGTAEAAALVQMPTGPAAVTAASAVTPPYETASLASASGTGWTGGPRVGSAGLAVAIMANINVECEVIRQLWGDMLPCGSLQKNCLQAVDALKAMCDQRMPNIA